MSKSKGRGVFHQPKRTNAPQSLEIANTLQQALALHQQGHLAQAESLYRAILKRVPHHFDSLHLLGVIAYQRKQYETAVQLIGEALKLDPKSASAHLNIGNALVDLKRHEEGIASYDRALAIMPDYADALNNRGIALNDLKRHDEALASYDRALALLPDYAEALNNRGVALSDLKRHEEALASYDRSLAIKPDHAEAHYNRGNALRDLKRHEEALASYDHALAINPDYAEARYNRADALRDLKRHEEAAKEFERLLGAKPDYDYVRGNIFNSQLHCCDWKDYNRNVELIANDVAAGRRAANPFIFLSVSESPSGQLRCARSYNAYKYPAAGHAMWQGERYGHDKIRLAYLSADFRSHATAYLMTGLFEAHDKARFETTAISFGRDSKDETRKRLESSFDRFIDVQNKSDRDAALLLKALEIDIAVDLKGYTQDSRPGIFAFRPAPIQVNYLGYPGTMGADYIDYILADRFVIPEDHHSFYTEKVVYLPDTYQPNDSKRRIGEHTPTRLEAGLPETGFVFCSFNNNYKIAPPVFDVWMRLVQQIEGSVLWLLEDNASAVGNLRREAENRGVAPDRLVFAPRMKAEDHLARHRLADCLLDTLPINAHTTASDALWAGLPMVTCPGSSFAGRVAGSLLDAVGLPELIAANLEDYEALALKLARDKSMLTAIKAKLAQNRETFPLFDTDRFRRHIESAYETMWGRCQRGEPPASFAVAP